MVARFFDDRSRAYGIAGTALVHVVGIGVILLFAPDYVPLPEALKPGLVAVDLTPPPPPAPPPPDDVERAGARVEPGEHRHLTHHPSST